MFIISINTIKRFAFIICSLYVGSVNSSALFYAEGGNHLKAEVIANYGYIDNYFYKKNSKESTSHFTLKPNVALQIESNRHLLQLSAELEHSQFKGFSMDNHTDYSFTPAWHYKFARNLSVYTKANVNEESEARGQGISYGMGELIDSRDKKQSKFAGAGLLYGSQFSRARFFTDIELKKSTYQTRREVSKIFDEQIMSSTVGFDYLLSGKSYVTTELQFKTSDYENNESADKAGYVLLLGYKWASTEITQLEALIGYEKINTAAEQLADSNYFKWRINTQWSPLTQLKFSLSTSRTIEGTNKLTNSYVVNDALALSILYELNDVFEASMGGNSAMLNVIYSDYQESETQHISYVAIKYKRSARLSINVTVQHESADNTLAENDYARTTVFIGFTANI